MRHAEILHAVDGQAVHPEQAARRTVVTGASTTSVTSAATVTSRLVGRTWPR